MAADIPEGFREEWVEEDARWRLATPEEQAVRPCRASPQHRCPNTVAAALNRGRYTQTGRTDAWWFYCPDHLYGRRIQNGRILHRRLIPTNPNTGPNIPPPPADAETASDTVTRAGARRRFEGTCDVCGDPISTVYPEHGIIDIGITDEDRAYTWIRHPDGANPDCDRYFSVVYEVPWPRVEVEPAEVGPAEWEPTTNLVGNDSMESNLFGWGALRVKTPWVDTSRDTRAWSVWQQGSMSGWMAGGRGELSDDDVRILNGPWPWGRIETDDPTTVIVGWRKIRFLPLRLVTTWVNDRCSRRLTFRRPTLDWLRRDG